MDLYEMLQELKRQGRSLQITNKCYCKACMDEWSLQHELDLDHESVVQVRQVD